MRAYVGLGLILCAAILFGVDQGMPVSCSSTATSQECHQGLQPPAVWLIIPILAIAGILLVVVRPRTAPPGHG